MSEITEDLAGFILSGSYHLTRRLGSGAMGEVYEAHHLRTGGAVAVKLLHRGIAMLPEIRRRFRDEARVAATLRHPSIVRAQDLVIEGVERPYLVMELLSGEDLEARLQRIQRLSLEQALTLANQVGSALEIAHANGVVHRDLKPQNIFLALHSCTDGQLEVAKVLDFGIAKVRWTLSEMTNDRALLGTPQYLAPEAAREGSTQVDGRADQFALAVILYKALSGELPFPGEDPWGVMYKIVHAAPRPLSAAAPWVPAPVAAVIMRGLAKQPSDRYPTIREFVAALGVTVSPRRIRSRHGVLSLGGMALCGAVLGYLAGWQRVAAPRGVGLAAPVHSAPAAACAAPPVHSAPAAEYAASPAAGMGAASAAAAPAKQSERKRPAVPRATPRSVESSRRTTFRWE